LVVIAVIALLAGLLLPALAHGRKRSQIQRARTECKQLLAAFHSYNADCSRWPVAGYSNETVTLSLSNSLYRKLCNLDRNDVGLPYLEYSAKGTDAAGNLVDPWGNIWRLRFDADEDGRVANPFAPSNYIGSSVLIWSKGPDGQEDAGGETSAANRDNITSW
jgi:type II secretory pathway pseudopilin PulG